MSLAFYSRRNVFSFQVYRPFGDDCVARIDIWRVNGKACFVFLLTRKPSPTETFLESPGRALLRVGFDVPEMRYGTQELLMWSS